MEFVDQQRGRFKTSNITNDPRQNCYQTTLSINDILPRDSMMYYVSIENDRGKTRFGIRLMVLFYIMIDIYLCIFIRIT